MTETNDQVYYQSVGEFYDSNCSRYEEFYWKNHTLQNIRQAFREHLKRQSPYAKNILEIGTGPGIDLVHFAKLFPESNFYGIDVSDMMLTYTKEKIKKTKCDNARIALGSVEDIQNLYPDLKFDLIYVFFGALNTVKDLELAAKHLHQILKSGGKMVLTFVNKYYLAEIGLRLLKGDFKNAFARQKKVWYGYSKDKTVESYCYSPTKIGASFSTDFEIIHRQGYSILHPAWYHNRWVQKFGSRIGRLLWKADEVLNRTLAWQWGEYTLYVLKKKDD